MQIHQLIKVTELAKSIMLGVLKKGDCVIDATMGNGNDTLFLKNIVGETGKVVSFDIQKTAIDHTRKLLEENHIYDHVQLIQDGHENMDQYVFEEVSGAMFNLGYLPKADINITTKPKTTMMAIEKCLNLLKKGGIITILIYYGHEGGEIEKEEVIHYVETLNQNKFHVLKVDYINQRKTPPILITIVKK